LKERLTEIYEKVKKLPKRKLIIYSAAIKAIEVVAATYIVKKFFLQ